MALELHTFQEKIKATKQQLEQKNGNAESSPLNLSTCMEFIKESVGFLNVVNTSSSATSNKQHCDTEGVTDWYPVFVKVLYILYEHRKKDDFSLEMVLSCINHIVVHLIKVNGVALDWFRLIGLFNLEFLAAYSKIPSHKPDFLSALVQKSYQCMRVFAQRSEKENKGLEENKGEYYALLVMGCAYLNLDTSTTEQDALKSCRGYISNFLQQFSGSGEKPDFVNGAEEVAKEIFQLSCVVYCLQVRCAQTEQDACFFKDLFRLVQQFPSLRDKMVKSGGNLLPVASIDDFNGLPISETKQLIEQSEAMSNENQTASEAFEFMMSVCYIVHSLMTQKSEVKAQKNSDLESDLKTKLEKSVSCLQAIFSDHPSPATKLPQYVGEVLSLLSNGQICASFGRLSVAVALLLQDLLSLAVDVMARDILCSSGAKGTSLPSSVASKLSHRSYDMAVINKSRMTLLQSLLSQSKLDNSVHVCVAGRLKCSLNLLCILAQRVKKGSGLSPDSSAYRTIFKTLKNSVSGVGTLCRQLRRSELYEAIISLAGPLWPVANLPDMLPNVTHHESLCEAYRVQGDVQTACQVVVQASALGGQLITSTLLKSVLKIAKTETTLKIPVLFSRCPDDKGLAALMTLARMMISFYSSSQSLVNHLETILRHLLASSGSLSKTDQLLVRLMLAETCWYHQDRMTESSSKDGEADNSVEVLDFLDQCMEIADIGCFDLKAQAALLASEIQHALACFKLDEINELSHEASAPKPSNGSKNTDSNDRLPPSDVDFSPSTPDNINMIPPTVLEAPHATPISKFSVLETPVTHSVFPTKYQRNIFSQNSQTSLDTTEEMKEGESSKLNMYSEELMTTAYKCLDMWNVWYQKFGDEICEKAKADVKTGTVNEAAIFCVERNLSFLQHLVCLASAHDKPIFALDCLYQAKQMASKVQKSDIMKQINNALLSLLGQFGLVHMQANSKIGTSQSLEKKGGLLVDDSDLFDGIETLKIDKDDPSSIVSAAVFLFSSQKIRESVQAQKLALTQIESCREKECLTPSLTLLLGELKCLMVECARLLELQAIYKEEDMPGQHPLQMVCEALKYVTSLKSFLMGKANHFLCGKGTSVDSWQVIYSYLNTLHLSSRVFLQSGLVKSARTYLQEGLRMAQSCRLATWTAVFMTDLSHLHLNYMDSVSESSKYLKGSCMYASPHMDERQRHSCGTESSDIDSVFLSLSAMGNNASQVQEKCKQSVWSMDFSPRLATVHVHRLWLQAEISLQSDETKFPNAIEHLLNAKHIASHLPCHLDFEQDWVKDIVAMQFDIAHQLTSQKLLFVETLLRLSQAYFIQVSETFRQGEVSENNGDVQKHLNCLSSLLEAVVREGKKLSSCYEGRVIVATAQLLKIHMVFLPLSLRQRSFDDDDKETICLEQRNNREEPVKDDVNEWEDYDEAASIAKEVKELKLEEDFWNEKRKQNLSSDHFLPSLSSLSTPVKSEIKSDSTPIHGRANLANTSPTPTISPVTSPTKRPSPTLKESSIPPTPPKMSKGEKRGLLTATTPVSFFSPSEVKPKRGRAKAGSKTSKLLEVDNMMVTDKENESCVNNISSSQQSKNCARRGRPKTDSKSKTTAAAEEQYSNLQKAVKIDTKNVKLSPITDQIAKLSIGGKSISPKNRKSEKEISGMDLDYDKDSNEQEGNNKSQSCTSKQRGRGKRTTTVSSVTSQRKYKLLNEVDAATVENHLVMKTVEETDRDFTKTRDDKENQKSDSETPQVKVKRTSKIKNTSSKETKITVTRRTRRVGKQTEKADSPEMQRATTKSPVLNLNLNFTPVSPIQDSVIDEDLHTEDSMNISMNSHYLPAFESPISRSPTDDTSWSLDYFSTPLKELHLNSPIEIPRGKTQCKVVPEKRQSTRGDKKRKNLNSSTEIARGLDDDGDDEQENISNQLTVKKKDLGSQNKRGKLLSLKKNTRKINVLCDSNSIEMEHKSEEIESGVKDEIESKADKENNESQAMGKNGKNGKSGVGGRRKASSDKLGVGYVKVADFREDLSGKSRVTDLRKNSSVSSRTPQRKPQFSELTSENNVVLEPGDGDIEAALESLRQLSAFPPSYIFNKLSKATALLLMRHARDNRSFLDSQAEVAGHLSNSMHVTFQHMLTKNLISKLRVKKSTDKHSATKSDEDSSTSMGKEKASDVLTAEEWEELEREKAVMKEVLEKSQLQWPVVDALTDKLQTIPKGWVVVQMAVVNLNLFNPRPCQVVITRMSSDCPPLTVSIPVDRWKHFECAKRVIEASIVHEVENMTPQKYWTYRYKNDQNMKNLIYFLQEKFLSGHKWLLAGHPGKMDTDKRISSILDRSAVHLASEIKHLGDESVDPTSLKTVMKLLLSANEKEIQSLLFSIWPKNIADLVYVMILKVQKEMWTLKCKGKEETDGGSESEKGPVILILDKIFNQIPWECMPILRTDYVTRVPSLTALQALLNLHQKQADSVFLSGVGRRNVITVIDPETNLESSVKFLQPQFEKFKGWKCQTQQALTVSALKEYLKQELYIYSGHGWGRQFVAGDELQMFRAKAVAIIMGCNSGKMEFAAKTDGQGAPLYFLLAGCPAVIGNLWMVTDKDIDKLTSHLVQSWMSSKGRKSLSHLLNGARKICKLVGLNGFAPVIYGLPIYMN